MGRHEAIAPPKPDRFVWVGGERVKMHPEGDYVHPTTGAKFHLSAGMSFHSGHGYAMSGWPVFWRELVPAGA